MMMLDSAIVRPSSTSTGKRPSGQSAARSSAVQIAQCEVGVGDRWLCAAGSRRRCPHEIQGGPARALRRGKPMNVNLKKPRFATGPPGRHFVRVHGAVGPPHSRMKCNPGRSTCSPGRRHDISIKSYHTRALVPTSPPAWTKGYPIKSVPIK
jgi:hypothetical protein